MAKKVRNCNREILPAYRPFCSVEEEERFVNTIGLHCTSYFPSTKCLLPSFCGVFTQRVICQNRKEESMLKYVKTTQDAIQRIKNDCKSCQKKEL